MTGLVGVAPVVVILGVVLIAVVGHFITKGRK